MMAPKVLFVLQLLVIFVSQALSYPSSIYGTKRFGRSTHRAAFDPYDSYMRTQRYPSYYGYYPTYSQTYPDGYYYQQESYPVYYQLPRTPKYDISQTMLPYYYQDLPVSKTKYDDYSYVDPSSYDQEKLVQDFEREQRERSQPIGHEIRYESDYGNEDETLDDTNAAFLNNLMMYQDQIKVNNEHGSYDRYPYEYPEDTDTPNYARWDDVPYDRPVKIEDEDVRELKELPKQKQKQERKNRKQRKQRKQKDNVYSNENPIKRSENMDGIKEDEELAVYTDRKPVVKEHKSETPTSSTQAPRRDVRGQKEEVMMRPATPVRHPFSDSVLEMISEQGKTRKRSPSVYDTIRHMLEVEKQIETKQANKDVRPSMKKRIVSSEDSLTKQLSVLKKAQ